MKQSNQCNEDEVLRRMLNTPPTKHKEEPKKSVNGRSEKPTKR